MRIFVTGASGWIGSAVVPELLGAGHQVIGLARSDAAAEVVAALGAEVRRGDLDDLAGLRAAAADSAGAVHLGYNHDFSQMGAAAQTDRAAIEAIGESLPEGSPFAIASGVLGLGDGGVATEKDQPPAGVHPRIENARVALSFAEKGIRPLIVRFAPTVHGDGDHGFLATLVGVAREKGVSAYVEDGSNVWPAVHRFDAATLVRLAVEKAPAGSVLHATAELGVPTREIAEAIGRGLNLPVESVPADKAPDHFGWIGRFFAFGNPVSSEATQQLLGWHPVHSGLIADLDAGYYFKQ
jgi:nucleoside-diphosphate-sugar epimerase